MVSSLGKAPRPEVGNRPRRRPHGRRGRLHLRGRHCARSRGHPDGWASLLIGFSAPIAVDAYAAGAFAHKLTPWLDPNLFGVVLIVLLTIAHAIGLRTSARVQNVLFSVKVVLLVSFVGLGVVFGHWAYPNWQAAHASAAFPPGAFAGRLFFIA